MKLLVIIFTVLFISSVSSQEHNWSFSEFGTICSIDSSNSVALDPNETIHYSVAFAYASKEHDLSEHLRAINLKPNNYVLQINIALHHPDDKWGILGGEIDIPVQLNVNGISLESIEDGYGVTYYSVGEDAKLILEKLNRKENIVMKATIGSREHLIPIPAVSKDFDLKMRLLQTCESHFN